MMTSILDFFSSSCLVLIAALVMDRLLGEPKSWHPLVWFGRWVDVCRHHIQLPTDVSSARQNLVGVLAWCMAVVPFVVVLLILLNFLPDWMDYIVSAFVLYFTIGWQSLREHGLAIYTPLSDSLVNDEHLDQARQAVGHIVSRDTQHLSVSDVSKASIESILENGSDAIFAPIFWFLLLGAPGALLYRLANTLDAMWGYKTSDLLHFGWFAARFDDVLNYVPARLVVISYSLCGQWRAGIRNACLPSARWKSPNAGPVMAAGAGSLGIQLGGDAVYFGQPEQRPVLGEGRNPEPKDIKRAIVLVDNNVYLWGIVVCLFL